ncbi:MAG TPA: two-component regulator propeller domain-containing protein, partial [Bacteroidia bacterium]|nr:two-component regulator propeller domain-containing protein [Bacteroidia bacterium]
MFKRVLRYSFLLLLLVSRLALAQQYNFKNYSAENGMPFVQVSCMIQDKQGYLWIGGYGGLSRFDGKVFLNFSPKNGLINHYVNTVCSSDSGVIYCGTAEGLSIINNKKITNYNGNNGLKNTNISSLCYDEKNGLYIGTREGVYILFQQKFIELPDFRGMEIKTLHRTRSGT